MHANLALPPGYSWDDISYVVGGVNRKARYVDRNGYLVTSAKDGSRAATQYNLEDDTWSDFHPGEKNKKYDCAACHTTGYRPDGHQGGLKGIVGRWAEDGIGCEACHGPGGVHAKNPAQGLMKVDRSQEACGKCHQRGGLTPKSLLDAGLVRHHDQINELMAGPHKGLSCVNCHNPHQQATRARYNCINCHRRVADSFMASVHDRAGLKCFDCHMPRVARSAISRVSYMGDIRSHLFRINVIPEKEMFTTIEEKGVKSTFVKGFICLECACLGCHSSRDQAWAAKHAAGMHKKSGAN